MREYSRFGKGPKNWPFNHRVIYSEEAYIEVCGKRESINYECDFLFPSIIAPEQMEEVVVSELYFVICLYGREFAVNCGGPYIDGYKNWLRENNGTSPLYRGDHRFQPNRNSNQTQLVSGRSWLNNRNLANGTPLRSA